MGDRIDIPVDLTVRNVDALQIARAHAEALAEALERAAAALERVSGLLTPGDRFVADVARLVGPDEEPGAAVPPTVEGPAIGTVLTKAAEEPPVGWILRGRSGDTYERAEDGWIDSADPEDRVSFHRVLDIDDDLMVSGINAPGLIVPGARP